MKAPNRCLICVPRRSRLAKVLFAVTVIGASVLLGSLAAWGAEKTKAKPPAQSDSQARKAAIQWLGEYLHSSALIKPADVAKIRETISNMPPAQLHEWLEQTRQLRAAVESPEWQETREWLQSFLKVQAIYSDKELEELRHKILTGDADQLLDIMDKIEQKRKTLSWMHRTSSSERKASIKGSEAFLKNQATAAKAARSSSGSRPLFGSASSTSRGNANTAKYSGRYPGVGTGSYGLLRGGWWGW